MHTTRINFSQSLLSKTQGRASPKIVEATTYHPVVCGLSQWAKSPKKQVRRSALLFLRHSKYSAMLLKIRSYRLLLRRFCPLGY